MSRPWLLPGLISASSVTGHDSWSSWWRGQETLRHLYPSTSTGRRESGANRIIFSGTSTPPTRGHVLGWWSVFSYYILQWRGYSASAVNMHVGVLYDVYFYFLFRDGTAPNSFKICNLHKSHPKTGFISRKIMILKARQIRYLNTAFKTYLNTFTNKK